MDKNDRIYLTHIVQSVAAIREFTENMNLDQFLADLKTQDAVMRRLEIIGEATKRVSEAFRQQHSEVPWKKMAGMRDKLIHDYMGIDLTTVWTAAKTSIPELEEDLRKLI
ncbi:MAG: DUF86 domain-containing protein [Ignavibacteriae bacterium]|nr:DUF86 domain-containing protein [Ignavibacteriota bacterium]